MAKTSHSTVRKSSQFHPVEFDDSEVNRLLPEPARRLLAMGRFISHAGSEFHALRAAMAQAAGVPVYQLRPLLALLTRLGLHTYVGRKRRYVSHTSRNGIVKLVYRLVPLRTWTPLGMAAPTGLTRTPEGLLARLRADRTRNHGGRRPGAGRPRIQVAPPSQAQLKPTTYVFLRKTPERASAREDFTMHTYPGPSSIAPVTPTPAIPSRVSRLRPRARVFGLARLARAQALGTRVLPPVPDAGLIPPVTVPAPALLPEGSPESDVRFLASAYRAATELRLRSPSLFMLRGDITKHRDFARLAEAAALMRAADIPPAAWVLFSFDVWREYRSGPATVAFTFSAKRLAERFEWFDRMRDAYIVGRSYLVPEHRALVEDHQAMMRALLCSPLESRADVLAVVDRFFPGASWEQRVAGAKLASQREQAQVFAAVAAGGLGRWT